MFGRKGITRRDVAIIGGIFIAAVFIAFMVNWSGGDVNYGKAEIRVNGETALVVDLTIDGDFYLPQNPHIHFNVREGAIAITESDCPDKVCVRTGYIYLPGQSATCLPNRVSVRIIGSGKADVFGAER